MGTGLSEKRTKMVDIAVIMFEVSEGILWFWSTIKQTAQPLNRTFEPEQQQIKKLSLGDVWTSCYWQLNNQVVSFKIHASHLVEHVSNPSPAKALFTRRNSTIQHLRRLCLGTKEHGVQTNQVRLIARSWKTLTSHGKKLPQATVTNDESINSLCRA